MWSHTQCITTCLQLPWWKDQLSLYTKVMVFDFYLLMLDTWVGSTIPYGMLKVCFTSKHRRGTLILTPKPQLLYQWQNENMLPLVYNKRNARLFINIIHRWRSIKLDALYENYSQICWTFSILTSIELSKLFRVLTY